jgi:hypothetical protein
MGMDVFAVVYPSHPPELMPIPTVPLVEAARTQTLSPEKAAHSSMGISRGTLSMPTTPQHIQEVTMHEEHFDAMTTANGSEGNQDWRKQFVRGRMGEGGEGGERGARPGIGEGEARGIRPPPLEQSHPVRDFYQQLFTGRPGANYEAHFSVALGGARDEETIVWLLVTTTKVLVLQSSESEAQIAVRLRYEESLSEDVDNPLAPLVCLSPDPPLLVLSETAAIHLRKVTFGLALQYLWLHTATGPPMRFMTRSKAVTIRVASALQALGAEGAEPLGLDNDDQVLFCLLSSAFSLVFAVCGLLFDGCRGRRIFHAR